MEERDAPVVKGRPNSNLLRVRLCRQAAQACSKYSWCTSGGRRRPRAARRFLASQAYTPSFKQVLCTQESDAVALQPIQTPAVALLKPSSAVNALPASAAPTRARYTSLPALAAGSTRSHSLRARDLRGSAVCQGPGGWRVLVPQHARRTGAIRPTFLRHGEAELGPELQGGRVMRLMMCWLARGRGRYAGIGSSSSSSFSFSFLRRSAIIVPALSPSLDIRRGSETSDVPRPQVLCRPSRGTPSSVSPSSSFFFFGARTTTAPMYEPSHQKRDAALVTGHATPARDPKEVDRPALPRQTRRSSQHVVDHLPALVFLLPGTPSSEPAALP